MQFLFEKLCAILIFRGLLDWRMYIFIFNLLPE